MHKLIGWVQILRDRIYPIDPKSDVSDPEATTVIVPPGRYPVYRNNDVTYWIMKGHINLRGFERLGDGMFALHVTDTPSDIEVTFSSKWMGPEEFAEFRKEAVCGDGPQGRMMFMWVDNEREFW